MSGLRFHRHWMACALLVPAAAQAHHSRTQYDGSEVQEIQGELTAVSWANPHATFSVRVTSASGETATWQLESWGSPYVLSRMGVTKEQFVVGTEVRLAGRVSTLVGRRSRSRQCMSRSTGRLERASSGLSARRIFDSARGSMSA